LPAEFNGVQRNMNIISFSGGKDSTALILWAKEILDSFQVVFCDTGWEDQITYDYIEYINKTLLNGELIVLKSEKYEGFADLSIKKKRIASTEARYCTTELKIIPTKNYIEQFEDVHLYNGIRADESPRRAAMDETVFDDYLKCTVHRPLLKWTIEQVFGIMEKYNIKPNPLYKMGMSRVGCMPCIMSNHKEMRVLIKNKPDVIEKILNLENEVGRTFFPPKYIPKWACSGIGKGGVKFPTVNDVVKYLQKNPNQKEMFEMPACMSFYGLCE